MSDNQHLAGEPAVQGMPEASRADSAAEARIHEALRRKRLSRRLMWSGTVLVLFAVALTLLLDARSTAHAPVTTARGTGPANVAVGPHVGLRAADFTLRDLKGKQVSLHGFAGKPLLIHFWAVDCPTCQAEQADYIRAVHDLGSKAPAILAVDAWGETADYISPYVTKHAIPGVVLVDLGHAVFSDLYQSIGTPTAVYVDSRGVIRAMVTGQESYSQIVANMKLIGA
jgi:cytochrome c biogenesis protein CcmG/thiol:disulfide interchange protein DsbE